MLSDSLICIDEMYMYINTYIYIYIHDYMRIHAVESYVLGVVVQWCTSVFRLNVLCNSAFQYLPTNRWNETCYLNYLKQIWTSLKHISIVQKRICIIISPKIEIYGYSATAGPPPDSSLQQKNPTNPTEIQRSKSCFFTEFPPENQRKLLCHAPLLFFLPLFDIVLLCTYPIWLATPWNESVSPGQVKRSTKVILNIVGKHAGNGSALEQLSASFFSLSKWCRIPTKSFDNGIAAVEMAAKDKVFPPTGLIFAHGPHISRPLYRYG